MKQYQAHYGNKAQRDCFKKKMITITRRNCVGMNKKTKHKSEIIIVEQLRQVANTASYLYL